MQERRARRKESPKPNDTKRMHVLLPSVETAAQEMGRKPTRPPGLPGPGKHVLLFLPDEFEACAGACYSTKRGQTTQRQRMWRRRGR